MQSLIHSVYQRAWQNKHEPQMVLVSPTTLKYVALQGQTATTATSALSAIYSAIFEPYRQLPYS